MPTQVGLTNSTPALLLKPHMLNCQGDKMPQPANPVRRRSHPLAILLALLLASYPAASGSLQKPTCQTPAGNAHLGFTNDPQQMFRCAF
jgi:hypothetical protein